MRRINHVESDVYMIVSFVNSYGCLSVQATFNTFFATAPQPHGQYISDKAKRVLGWECQHSPPAMERTAAGKTQYKASL